MRSNAMGAEKQGQASPFAIILLIMLPLLSSYPTTVVTAGESDVRGVVEGLNTTLLDVMQSADKLGYEGRYQKLEPSLRSSFDFAFMAKIAVGRAWNDFDRGQRKQLVERFTRMSIATFAARFDGYSGERFEILGEKPGRRNTVIVDDRIIRPKDPPVGLNFVLKQRGDGRWQIIDVMLDGKFSELARQRAEFSSVLKRGGYDELIAALDEQIATLKDQS
ncbi:MAG: ABC transporter substrate-binding protein [Geminicoccaceae bacterium]